MIYNGPVTNN